MLLQMLSPPDHVILLYTEASLHLYSIRFPIHLWSWWCWTVSVCDVCVCVGGAVKMATFNFPQGSSFGQTPPSFTL